MNPSLLFGADGDVLEAAGAGAFIAGRRRVIHLCSVLRCLIFAGKRRMEATIYPVAQVAQLGPLRET
jgi:hypothetical protein